MDRNKKKIFIIVITTTIFYLIFNNIYNSYKSFPEKIDINSLEFTNWINNINFNGYWNGKNLNDLLFNKNGKIKFNLSKRNYRIFQNYTYHTKNLIMGNFLIFDPEFFDENVWMFDIELNINITGKNTLTYINKKKINVFQWYNTNFNKIRECELTVNIDFNSEIFNNNEIIFEKFSKIKNVINIKAYNKSCGINLDADLSYEKKNFFNDNFYTIFILIFSLINLNSSLKLIKMINNNPNKLKSINIITMIINACFDLYLFIFHMNLSIEDDNIMNGNFFYLIPSFLYFMIFSLVDLNILFLIWKNNNLELFNTNFDEFKKKINLFHIKINLIGFLFVILFNKFYLSPFIILLVSFLLYPQIYQYYKNGMIFDIDFNYLIFFNIFKLFIFIYFRLFKNNILLLKPYYSLMMISIGILIFSMIIIFIQSYFGPKFFLPKILNKNKYDYFSINSNISKNYKINNNEVILI